MPIMRKLRASWLSLIIVAVRILTLVGKLGLSIFIARDLGFTELGTYGLIVATSALLPTLAGLGLITAHGRLLVIGAPSERILVLRNTWLVAFVVYAIMTVAALMFDLPGIAAPILLLTFVVTILEHLNNDASALLIANRDPLSANLSYFLRGAAWIFLIIPLGTIWPALHTLEAMLAAWAIAAIACLLLFAQRTRDWPWRDALYLPLRLDWYRASLCRSVLFMGSDLANACGQYLDRYVIGFIIGLELTGVYVFFSSITNALSNLISTGILQIQRPALIETAHAGDHDGFRSLLRHTAQAALATAAAFAWSAAALVPLVLPFLNRPLAEAHLDVLFLLLAGLMLRTAGDLASAGLFAHAKDREFTFSNVLGLPLTLTLVPLFTTALGLLGATLATQLVIACVLSMRLRALLPLMRSKRS